VTATGAEPSNATAGEPFDARHAADASVGRGCIVAPHHRAQFPASGSSWASFIVRADLVWEWIS
jgi:hypothetical protein